MSEFNLSEKEMGRYEMLDAQRIYHEEDVKEFIKRLKDKMIGALTKEDQIYFLDVIDKLAGEELTDIRSKAKVGK